MPESKWILFLYSFFKIIHLFSGTDLILFFFYYLFVLGILYYFGLSIFNLLFVPIIIIMLIISGTRQTMAGCGRHFCKWNFLAFQVSCHEFNWSSIIIIGRQLKRECDLRVGSGGMNNAVVVAHAIVGVILRSKIWTDSGGMFLILKENCPPISVIKNIYAHDVSACFLIFKARP